MYSIVSNKKRHLSAREETKKRLDRYCNGLLPKVKNITSRFGINALNAMPKAHKRDPATGQINCFQR
jgi:hypothetical protein